MYFSYFPGKEIKSLRGCDLPLIRQVLKDRVRISDLGFHIPKNCSFNHRGMTPPLVYLYRASNSLAFAVFNQKARVQNLFFKNFPILILIP